MKRFYEIDGDNVRVADWSQPGYRLPTEAEWEYACRANAPTRYSFGDDATSLGEFAWYDGNSGSKTHPVGEKRPNGFGLFDMHGNVWEWCWDGGDAYKASRVDDPTGLDGAAFRVIRSGSWVNDARFMRSVPRRLRAFGPELQRGLSLCPSSVSSLSPSRSGGAGSWKGPVSRGKRRYRSATGESRWHRRRRSDNGRRARAPARLPTIGSGCESGRAFGQCHAASIGFREDRLLHLLKV